MARVFSHWEYRLEFVDSGGQKSSVTVQLRNGEADAITAIEGAMTAVRAAYTGASKCTLISDSARMVFVEDAITLPADAQREQKAVISFALTGKPLDSGRVTVPAPVTSLFVAVSGANSDIVSGASANVLALHALYAETGGVATLSDGDTVPDNGYFLSGYRKHYASGSNSLPRFG